VLLIKTLKPNDSGAYICELNSDPVLRSIHILTGEYRQKIDTLEETTCVLANLYLSPYIQKANDL